MAGLTGAALEDARNHAQAAVRDLRERRTELDQDSLDVILTDARSHYAWQDKPVPEALLHQLYEITASGPTSMNTCPARFIFVTSAEGKQRLARSLKEKNIDKERTTYTKVTLPFETKPTFLVFLFLCPGFSEIVCSAKIECFVSLRVINFPELN